MFKTCNSPLFTLLLAHSLWSQDTRTKQLPLAEQELVWDHSVKIQVSIPAHSYQNILIK
jgi:hypothetical protein